MKSMVELTCLLLKNIETMTGISTSRDIQTVVTRHAEEGDSFLTITLPSLDKEFLQALDKGMLDQSLFVGIRRLKGTEIPSFLGNLLSEIFRLDGVLHQPWGTFAPRSDKGTGRSASQEELIRLARCVFLLHSKVEIPCTDARTEKMFLQYIATDSGLSEIPKD